MLFLSGWAQVDPDVRKEQIRNAQKAAQQTSSNANTVSGQRNNGPRKDSLSFEHRDDAKDSINISFRYFDSTRRQPLDSSIIDFDAYFSVPSSWVYLGNHGAAAHPLIFKPYDQAGWDPGFHAYDVYRYTLENTKFYKTTRPFSMIAYQLASGKEQMIKATHTQNPMANLNVGFDYRLISAPGLFVTQNTNHNSYRLFGNYQGRRKRYAASLVAVGNTLRASENGGIQNDSFLLDPNRKDRFSVPVNLGSANGLVQNPFVTTVNSGNTYRDFTFFYRHSYDIGKRDSIAINDSTTEYLFFPKLRFQHTFQVSSYNYQYKDILADSAIYANWYNLTLKDANDTVWYKERWSQVRNDFSLVQFPDTKNQAQFFLAGIRYDQIKQENDSGTNRYYNLSAHAEYRNRTRNKKWDLLLTGELYLNGLNSGNYRAFASIERLLSKKLGYVQLYFQNSNRSPSFQFDPRTIFSFGNNNSFKNENIVSFGATATNPFFTLGFRNHLITNYTYLSDYYHRAQYSKAINLLQVVASKKISISKKWKWYIEAALQQVDGAAPIRVPLLYTRNRLAFEGKFFKNLRLSTGVEMRYFTPYKMDAYSPVLGKFFPQDSVTVKNLPDIHVYAHFRIRSFAGYLRVENLNTARLADGFSFTNNNFAAPLYPTPGMMIRFGIQWWFVN
jgi:hypothetical protein